VSEIKHADGRTEGGTWTSYAWC